MIPYDQREVIHREDFNNGKMDLPDMWNAVPARRHTSNGMSYLPGSTTVCGTQWTAMDNAGANAGRRIS
jgi:hypothetical protein